jgi:hypothetical protein
MEKYTAVIIEPRIHNAWQLVLNNFLNNLDERWNILIICGLLNKDFLTNLIDTHFQNYKHRIQFHIISIENFTIDQYSQYMMYKDVYNIIPTETFLIFQLDTLISNRYKDFINDFIKYDYVGAPWAFNNQVGNGGLSLRKKSVILNVLDKYNPYEYDGLEDTYYAKYITNKPTFEEAKLFSVETVFSEKSFGIHKCWNHLHPSQISEIAEYIPELPELIRLHTNGHHVRVTTYS